jgi:hypothetical protein
MYKIKICIVELFLLTLSNISAQENQTDNKNWFQKHFDQRVYLGLYDSFGDENANVVQAGYDAVLNLLNITPTWYLFDFCLGLDVLFVRDQINKESVDNFGHTRATENRLIPAFELNWGVKLYFLPIPKIRTCLYFEAVPITFVVYTQPYPDSGTHVNVGTHFGFGFKSKINDALNIFTTVRIFSHTSNGQPEETNPALDMVGLIVGLQF